MKRASGDCPVFKLYSGNSYEFTGVMRDYSQMIGDALRRNHKIEDACCYTG